MHEIKMLNHEANGRTCGSTTILEGWLRYRNPSRLSGSWSQNRLAGYHVILRSSQSLPLSLVRPMSHPEPVVYLPPACQSIMIYFNADYSELQMAKRRFCELDSLSLQKVSLVFVKYKRGHYPPKQKPDETYSTGNSTPCSVVTSVGS